MIPAVFLPQIKKDKAHKKEERTGEEHGKEKAVSAEEAHKLRAR